MRSYLRAAATIGAPRTCCGEQASRRTRPCPPGRPRWSSACASGWAWRWTPRRSTCLPAFAEVRVGLRLFPSGLSIRPAPCPECESSMSRRPQSPRWAAGRNLRCGLCRVRDRPGIAPCRRRSGQFVPCRWGCECARCSPQSRRGTHQKMPSVHPVYRLTPTLTYPARTVLTDGPRTGAMSGPYRYNKLPPVRQFFVPLVRSRSPRRP